MFTLQCALSWVMVTPLLPHSGCGSSRGERPSCGLRCVKERAELPHNCQARDLGWMDHSLASREAPSLRHCN